MRTDSPVASTAAKRAGRQGLPGGFGQGIGKDIAKIQPCRMPALAIEAIGVARDGSMLGTHGHNLQRCFGDIQIEFRLGAWPLAAGEDDGGFHQRGRRQEPDGIETVTFPGTRRTKLQWFQA